MPPVIWARALVLFCLLALLKCALLVQMGKHIFESHWRVQVPETTTLGKAAFFGFVALGMLSLFRITLECRTVQATRMANALVVGLGLAFIFLTFHSGENNFLYPILTGVLPWSSLGPYLSLKLCFERPFLGGWILAYIAGYYVLARTGRERHVLRMTAVFAGAYASLNLRELSVLREEFILVDCIAIAALMVPGGWLARGDGRSEITNATAPNIDGRERLKAESAGSIAARAADLVCRLLLPLAWIALFAIEMFRFAPGGMGLSFTYFSMLLSGTLVIFAGAAALASHRRFSGAWTRFAFFFVSAFVLLTDSHHPIAPNFNRLLCLGLESPHYFVGELSVVAAFVVFATAGRRIFGRRWLWLVDGAAVLLIALALVDFRLAQLLGVRLGWDVLELGNSARMMWRMAAPYLPLLGAAMLVLGGIYAGMLRWLRIRFEKISSDGRAETQRGARLALVYAATLFVLLGITGGFLADPDKAEGQPLVQLVRTSSVWKRAFARPMTPDELLRTAQHLGLGDLAQPPAVSTRKQRDLNVLLIFLESTYNKHLSLFSGSEETQPLLSRYKERMEVYPNFFSCFASSIHARFASFTGLYPVRDYNAFTLERVPVKSIFEVMHEQGYHSSLFYSSYLDFTGFRNFLAHRGLDEIYDADTMPGALKTERVAWGLKEEDTLEAMRAQLKKYAAQRERFFLTYVPAAPHYPFDRVPERFQKYKPYGKEDLKARYLNELLYMDWVLSSLVDELKENGLLEQTLVVITDDHGEMLGGKGEAMGHGWWLNPELVNAPLIVMDPEKPGYRVNTRMGSQVDLLPTMLDELGIPVPQEQLYEGCSLLRPAIKGRVAWLNSYQQYVVGATNTLIFGDREKPRQASAPPVYRLRNDGAKTLFDEAGTTKFPASIEAFDKFQESLLRNYEFYCRTVGAVRAPTVARGN